MGEAEIKVFEIKGLMMLSHDSFPTWQKFTVYVREASISSRGNA